jgi:hypothetical protein
MGDLGVQNKWAKGILGFGAEVLGDPLSYVDTGLSKVASGFITKNTGVLAEKSAQGLGKALTKDAIQENLEKALKKYGVDSVDDAVTKAYELGDIADNSNTAFNRYVQRGVFGDDKVYNAIGEANTKMSYTLQKYLTKYNVATKQELAQKFGMDASKYTPDEMANVIDNYIAQKAFGKEMVRDLGTKVYKSAKLNNSSVINKQALMNQLSDQAIDTTDIAYKLAQRADEAERAGSAVADSVTKVGDGLKVFGQEIVPGTQMRQLGVDIAKKVDEIPGIGNVLNGLRDGADKIFNTTFVQGLDDSHRIVYKMLKDKAKVLCDDRNIVRIRPDGFHVYGSWSHGDVPIVSPSSAPLKALLFLKQSDKNQLIPIKDIRESR